MNADELSPQQLNLVSAMIMQDVDYNDKYEPKFAVDCFSPLQSGNYVNVLWEGDYEFSLWNPIESWKDLGEIVEDFSIVIMPVFENEYSSSNRVGWNAYIPTFVGEDPYGFSCRVINYDYVVENTEGERERVFIQSKGTTPNEAVIRVLIEYYEKVIRVKS